MQKSLGRRLLALLLCVAFLAVSAFSAGFIVSHAEHIHDTHGVAGSCMTCAHIVAAGQVFRQIATLAAIVAVLLGGLFLLLFCVHFTCAYARFTSPVYLKVRMNN
ncbi:MAG: hypothetical protein LBS96_07645 [Oscillospiraceae bacterium]|jgi:hypothetical protein|nr:hypothetical protein [Oscillospiraceae bacterium]